MISHDIFEGIWRKDLGVQEEGLDRTSRECKVSHLFIGLREGYGQPYGVRTDPCFFYRQRAGQIQRAEYDIPNALLTPGTSRAQAEHGMFLDVVPSMNLTVIQIEIL